MTQDNQGGFFHNLDLSATLTVIGIVLLFSTAVAVTLIAPNHVDPTWTSPTSPYQVQMYEVSDPNLYISSSLGDDTDLQFVYHIKQDYTLLAFRETATVRITAPKELEKYVTKYGDPTLKLTARLLLLRKPEKGAKEEGEKLQEAWIQANPNWEKDKLLKPNYTILELYDPGLKEAFSQAPFDGILENWVDEDYVIVDETAKQNYHTDPGVIYVNNPEVYRIRHFVFGGVDRWTFDPEGEPIKTLDELKSLPLGFRSRQELIQLGEHFFAIEGCWYCHTDQTRTLVQDVVLNGSDSYPAPPSSANEYIYQKITFPGTRRIGPDLSRVGVKRPSRDWHKSHFWSPKTESKGSIMPAFQHFFDYDPRGSNPSAIGVPNYQFEALFQYLMTKGTRITPPTEAWWLGKDPVQTKLIIEGKKTLP